MGAWGWGTGRERTLAGKYLDRAGLSQREIQKATGLGEATLTRICSDNSYRATDLTKRTFIRGLRELGYDVEFGDLGW